MTTVLIIVSIIGTLSYFIWLGLAEAKRTEEERKRKGVRK